MERLKKILLIIAIVVVSLGIIYLGATYAMSSAEKISKDNKNPIVEMEIEGYGKIKIELYPDMAPNTVKNFVTLVKNGYYNGKTISEIGEDRIVGGLDLSDGSEEKAAEDKKDDAAKDDKKDENAEATVEGDEEEEEYVKGPKLSDIRKLGHGEEDEGYAIAGEFVEAGYTDNNLSHQRGVISMERETYEDYQSELSLMQMMGYDSYLQSIVTLLDNTAGSGFFIVTKDNIEYDGNYAAFGRVIEGMDVVDKIAKAEVKTEKSEDKKEDVKTTTPKEEIKIKTATVDTKGIKYTEPVTSMRYDFNSLFSSLLQSATGSSTEN